MFPNKTVCKCGHAIQRDHHEWWHACKNFKGEKYLGVVCKAKLGIGKLCECHKALPKRA